MNSVYDDRLKRVFDVMASKKLDAVILTDGYNIHYISGYRGHTGCMLIAPSQSYILTDSRYTEQVTIEAPDAVCVDIGREGYSKTMKGLLTDKVSQGVISSRLMRVGFENEHISYRQFKGFSDVLMQTAELISLDGSINHLRMIKNNDEIEYIERAEQIGDEAFEHIVKYIEEGMAEQEIALELEYTMRRLGASGLSFDTIAASGHNSSLPHAVPTSRKVSNGDFLTMDFGCVYEGYCSDMTRTVLIGDEPSEKQIEVYQTVLKAQLEALKLIKPGARCSDVDKCARNIIADSGYGDYFGHGLGHSIGLYIHEEPRLSSRCDELLQPGMLMTVEPGIYLPGEFGVRIEDLVVVTEDGYRNLTKSPKAVIML